MSQITPCITDSICFSIGQTSIAIDNPSSEKAVTVPAAYQPFITSAVPDIRIGLQIGQPSLQGCKKIFDSSPIWSLYRGQGRKVYSIYSQLRERAHSFCLFDTYSHAEIQFSPDFSKPIDPFCGPALELLTIENLARASGCLLHGCGIRLNDSGILFAGKSEAGKSTMLKLWDGEKDALILSDDRAIAQHSGSQLRIYGTPWHGKARGGVPDSAWLAGIFFLKHGPANKMNRLSATDAVRKLLTCSFPPLWDAQGMSATLDFFSTVGRRIPCYELEFFPDPDVISFLRQWMSREGSQS